MNEYQNQPILDKQVLDSLKESIGDAINKIITVYLSEVPINTQHLQEAMLRRDYETVGRIAHSLKSSSANVGAMQLSALNAELELYLKRGLSEAPYLNDMVFKLEKAFRDVRPMLIEYIG